jgi:hypothetical protein
MTEPGCQFDGNGSRMYESKHCVKFQKWPILTVGGIYVSMEMSLRPRICRASLSSWTTRSRASRERLQRRIEGNSVLLAVAVELHLGEADVRHPGAASLENIFVAVGFQITADLACLSTSRSCEAFCFLLAYRILVVCVHVLDYALPSGILLGFGCCHIGRVARLWSSVDVARSSQMVSSRSKNGAEKPPPCANAPT